MADEIVQKIKENTDIVELIGDSVRLQKKGRSYGGLCPFHDEKTPSFMVSPERGTWHCFGCGKGGDVFTFVMEKEGLSFPEAMEYLARRAGITIPKRRGQSQQTNDLYEVMEMAIDYYRRELKGPAGAAGVGYLTRRNMGAADIDRFELGWSQASWRSLNDALRSQGVTQDQLIKCGLVIQGDMGCYDRFRGRVIFPIRNVSGRAIALGGRIVDGEGAKYLNSPEGPLYNKKNNLYLLDKAKNAIREKGRSILVEGYMDAIRLHMHGHQETVASLGTSLTEEQAALLKRFSDKCFICYDADTAGQNAILRGMYILQRAGLQVYVVRFPGGKDPDEMLQTEGGEELFDNALATARPLVLHHIGIFRELAKTAGEVKAAEDLLDGMSQLSPVELAPYMQEIAHAVGLPDYQLAKEIDRRRSRRRVPLREEDSFIGADVIDANVDPYEDEPDTRPADEAEAAALYLLWHYDGIRRGVELTPTVRMFLDDRLKDIAGALLTGTRPQTLEEQWHEIGDTFQFSTLAAGAMFCDTLPGDDIEKWRQLSADLTRRSCKARFEKIRALMLRGEAEPEDLQEYMQLAAQLKGGGRAPNKNQR